MDSFKIQFFIKLQNLIKEKIAKKEDPNHPLNQLLLTMWADIGSSLTREEIRAVFNHNLKINNQLN